MEIQKTKIKDLRLNKFLCDVVSNNEGPEIGKYFSIPKLWLKKSFAQSFVSYQVQTELYDSNNLSLQKIAKTRLWFIDRNISHKASYIEHACYYIYIWEFYL